MSREPLLLPSARSGVLVERPPISPLWRLGTVVIGFIVVAVGAADVISHMSERVLGNNANILAFAPLIIATDPSLLNAVTGVSATTTTPFAPHSIRIPTIGVDARVEAVGKKPDGAMATPSKFSDIAWYSPGAKPGGPGNAVFAGHINNALNMAGVFAKLSELKTGDVIVVEGAGEQELIYRVTSMMIYPEDTAPAGEIFTTSGPSKIVLITCDGEWDSPSRSYTDRLVVVAELASLW